MNSGTKRPNVLTIAIAPQALKRGPTLLAALDLSLP